MKIHLLGFTLKAGAGVTMAGFVDFLRWLAGKEIDFKGEKRLLFLGKRSGYHTGAFITIRDEQRFSVIRGQGRKLEFSSESLGDGARVIDYNLFVINESTNCGLYHHYHRSPALVSFTLFLGKRYREYHDLLVAQAIGTGESEITARKRLKGYLNTTQVARSKDQIEKMIDDLEDVEAIRVSTVSPPGGDEFAPISAFVKRAVYYIQIVTESHGLLAVKRGIKRFIRGFTGMSRGSVIGSEENETRTLRLMSDTPLSFGEFESEEVLPAKIKCALEEIHIRLDFVTRMIRVAEDNPSIFGQEEE